MIDKAYLSNICTAWPIERQQAALGPRSPVYQDKLSKNAIRNGNPATLLDRVRMLAPTSRKRPEQITVASFRCLAFSSQDLAEVIATAAARNATLHALDTGVTIPPDAPGSMVAAEIAAFGRVVRRGGKGRTKEEISEERRTDTLRRIALIAEDWPKSEHTTAELLLRAGPRPGVPMAPSTARDHLDPRPERQRAYQNEINREAGRAAARARKKEPQDAE